MQTQQTSLRSPHPLSRHHPGSSGSTAAIKRSTRLHDLLPASTFSPLSYISIITITTITTTITTIITTTITTTKIITISPLSYIMDELVSASQLPTWTNIAYHKYYADGNTNGKRISNGYIMQN